MEAKFPTDLMRNLKDPVITNSDVDKYDTFIISRIRSNGTLKFIPVVKQVVISEIMRKHGKICKKIDLVKYGFKMDNECKELINSEEIINSDDAGLEENETNNDMVIIFTIDITDNILDNIT